MCLVALNIVQKSLMWEIIVTHNGTWLRGLEGSRSINEIRKLLIETKQQNIEHIVLYD